MKRMLAILLILSLLAGMLVVSASAEEINYNDITVEIEPYEYYEHGGRAVMPVVKYKGELLLYGEDYTLSYAASSNCSAERLVTVTGIREFAGYQKTVSYVVLKQDISKINDVNISVYQGRDDTIFYGGYCTPEATLQTGTSSVSVGLSNPFVFAYENNINVGDAVVRAYGRENYYGTVKDTFQIKFEDTYVTLEGAYNGVLTGTLDDDVYYSERVLTPGIFTGFIDCFSIHSAYYALYKMEGEEAKLIHEQETEFSSFNRTAFVYDFTTGYENVSASGGDVYMLAYSWIEDADGSVYSGVMVLYVPTKAGQATSMKVEQVPDVGNYYTQYLTYHGEDGVLETPKWSTSDVSVATVDDGTVTFQKPGSVTITAKSGKLSDSVTLTATAQDLSKGYIFAYPENEKKAYVYYDGYLLQEGVDYTTQTRTEGFTTQVTVTGINFFEGQLTREFVSGICTHNFDNDCDTSCNSCDFTRETEHRYGTNWRRDPENHWHSCTVCGDKIDVQAHVILPEQPDVCTVCGPLKVKGDLDGSCEVDEEDVIYLLQHVLMPDDFPVAQLVDYDDNNTIDEDDVIYLLQHVLMPEDFPLKS